MFENVIGSWYNKNIVLQILFSDLLCQPSLGQKDSVLNTWKKVKNKLIYCKLIWYISDIIILILQVLLQIFP
mgnify:CR=1 FL=1